MMTSRIVLVIALALPSVALAAPPAGLDIERGLKKCRICHGTELTGKRKVPGIAGVHRLRLMRKMTTDVPKKMKPVVRGLSEDEKRAIAEHVSKLAKPSGPATDPPKPEPATPAPSPEPVADPAQ